MKQPQKRTNKRKAYRTKKPQTKLIRRVVNSMVETKTFTKTQLNQSCQIWSTGVVGYFQSLCPNFIQGVTAHTRIGNSINVKSAVLTGYINVLPYNSVTNPFPNIKVRLLICSYRNKNTNYNQASTIVSNEMEEFLDAGGTAGIPFQGNALDMLLPVNKDKWICHKSKIINLALNGSTATYSIGDAPVDAGGSVSKFFKFYVGKHLGKLLYDDITGGNYYPVNKNLWFIIQPVRTDGTASTAIIPCEVHSTLTIKFKDM